MLLRMRPLNHSHQPPPTKKLYQFFFTTSSKLYALVKIVGRVRGASITADSALPGA